jgi:hypothetical protein
MEITEEYVGKWHGQITDSKRDREPSYPGDIVITKYEVKPYYEQDRIKTWGELIPLPSNSGSLVFSETDYKASGGQKVKTWTGTLTLTLSDDSESLFCEWTASGQTCKSTMVKTPTLSEFVFAIRSAQKLLD